MNEVEKYLKLYDEDIILLADMAHEAKKEYFKKRTVECCSIVSAKTGLCAENCKYCAQSAISQAKIEKNPLLSTEEVKNAALSAKENGAKYFAIVTSGTKLCGSEFERVLEMTREIAKIDGIKPCACLGLLSLEQMKALKEAGCVRYNHNINTSENYYKEICTTHTFQDRIKTIELAKQAGLDVCVGVIIGMGETREERIKMALTLKEINPISVPFNVLDPIKGTPLENFGDKIDEDEILKTLCIFNIILPNIRLRYAGGRAKRLSAANQAVGFLSGVNGMIVGNMLTTTGVEREEDEKILSLIGFEKE